MKIVHVFVPSYYVEALDQLVAAHFYPNRSEAIRHAVRDLINTELRWRKEAAAK
jgi:Arc/MetJ-type ribon-helix-helix transcriptional regulator